jgi:hypothetical protein
MLPIGQTDDEIRISTTTLANHLNLLSIQGVMRMGDGDESRNWWG